MVGEYGFTFRDAWNCTLREYIMLYEYKKQNPIRQKEDPANHEEILEFFELKELYNG